MPKTATNTKKEQLPQFEKALEELETIVEQMEDGDLSLENALTLFEQGVSLSRQCQTVLRQAEQKIQILTLSGNEEPMLSDIENDDIKNGID